jgi:hypothetical protein
VLVAGDSSTWSATITGGRTQRFGYPPRVVRTESAEGWTGPIQWFERMRLKGHRVNSVMAGRVGVLFLLAQGRRWESFPRASQAAAGCRFFPETATACVAHC